MLDFDQKLLDLARASQQRAYAPYSKFRVGACLRTTADHYFSGCNVENAAFGACLCAEHNAIGHLINAGDRAIAEVLIYTDHTQWCFPCGNCRQLLAEFASDEIKIHSINLHLVCKTVTLGQLLPHRFSQHNIENTK